MHKLRIYVDTSVVGGCYDDEFRLPSRALFQMVKENRIVVLVSLILVDELMRAPTAVQKVLEELPLDALERVELTAEASDLQRAYLKARVVGAEHGNDALHVALATVARADLIVSWNFRHIVHFDRIRGFNAVNLKEGYLPIEIRSPREVVP